MLWITLPVALVAALDSGSADDAQAVAAAEFAPPRLVFAGDAPAGAERLFPSPVLHDVDGDGARDLVIADLFGRLTVARASGDSPGHFEGEGLLRDRDGGLLKFHNW